MSLSKAWLPLPQHHLLPFPHCHLHTLLTRVNISCWVGAASSEAFPNPSSSPDLQLNTKSPWFSSCTKPAHRTSKEGKENIVGGPKAKILVKYEHPISECPCLLPSSWCQLPAHANARNLRVMDQALGPPSLMGEAQIEFPAPAFSLMQHWCCDQWAKWISGWKSFVFPAFLSLCLCFSNK